MFLQTRECSTDVFRRVLVVRLEVAAEERAGIAGGRPHLNPRIYIAIVRLSARYTSNARDGKYHMRRDAASGIYSAAELRRRTCRPLISCTSQARREHMADKGEGSQSAHHISEIRSLASPSCNVSRDILGTWPRVVPPRSATEVQGTL